MASAGQACWQAVRTSPSASGRPAASARSLPAWMRWVHSEHFSITPRERTTTSGLSTMRPRSLFMA